MVDSDAIKAKSAHMRGKNALITAVTVAITLLLTAYIFVGLDYWLSTAGALLAAAIIVASCTIPLVSRFSRSPSGQGETSLQDPVALPGWVRSMQRVAFLLFILVLVHAYYVYG